MPFCEKCGNPINDSAVFCSACGQKRGQPVHQQQPTGNQNFNTAYNGNTNYSTNATASNYNCNVNYRPNYNSPNNVHPLIRNLIEKIQIEAIVWIVIASIQALLFITYIFSLNYFLALFMGIVCALNFVYASKDFKYTKEIASNPVGIVDKYQPFGSYIATLIYNIIFGGLIGVVGSIFCFITRAYVMKNEVQFRQLEKDYLNDTSEAPVFGNQWKCKRCGYINPHYTTTCKCGQTKAEN